MVPQAIQAVAEILREHVTLEVEGIDRMYLNVMCRRCNVPEELRVLSGSIWATGSTPVR
jgi:hypothetical protein